MFVKWIATLIVAVNANSRAGEVAAGVSIALLLALIPSGNLLWFCLFLVTFFLKINLGAELLFLALFKLLAPLTDGLLHRLGRIADTQKQATDAVKSKLESQLEKLPLPKLKF